MSSARTHLAKTAAFTPAGGSLWSMTDLVDIDDGENGSAVDLVTDASQTVNGMFVDAIKGEITVVCKDLAHTINAGCAIGATGSLVVAYGLRTIGKGFVSGNTLSVTYANAQLRDIRRRGSVTGDGTISFVFGAFDPSGTAVKSAAVA
jgi:hypothetical protein